MEFKHQFSRKSSKARGDALRRASNGDNIAFQQSEEEERRERQARVLQEVNSALNDKHNENPRRKLDPRLVRWQVDEGRQQLAEATKSSVVLDLGLLSNPLACNTVGTVAGYRNTPYQKPNMAAVKPPWNYDSEEAAIRHIPKHEKNAVKMMEPELQVTKEMKEKIEDLDKRINKIDAFRQGRSRSARKKQEAKDPQAETALKAKKDHLPALGNSRKDTRAPEDQNCKTALKVNAMMKELINKSNSQCVANVKEIFQTLLDEELKNIAETTAMSKASKHLLSRAVKAAVKRRVQIEMEKKKLFDWPEDAVKQYASQHIKAEREKRRKEIADANARESRMASIKRAKNTLKSFSVVNKPMLPALAAVRADTKLPNSREKSREKVPSRTGTGGRERAALGSRSGLGSRGSLPSRSSVRAPGTPLGVVVEEQDRASPLQAVAEDCDNSFDKFEDAEMNTARVIDVLRGVDTPDPHFLCGVSKLNLGMELIGRNSIKALQSILPMLKNLKVLDLSSNDLGAASFQGLMRAMYRATSLPLEDLDLSRNSFGADGGHVGISQLTVYLGKVSPQSGMPGHSIKRLNLRGCMLGDTGAIQLAAALHTSPTIQELDLSENAISDTGARRLGSALVEGNNRMMGWLSLAYNDIGPIGCHWIGKALEMSGSHIRILNLSWNPRMGQDGIERLAQALLNNTILEELFVEACEIGDGAIDVIVLLSSKNKTMRTMHMQDNNFTLHGKSRLWRLLSEHSTPMPSVAQDSAREGELKSDTTVVLSEAMLNSRIASKSHIFTPRGHDDNQT